MSAPAKPQGNSLHYVRRFTGGFTPTALQQVNRARGGRNWFVQQLTPARVADPMSAQIDAWFPSLRRTPAQIFQRQKDGTQGAWEVMYDLSRATTARRIYSNRPVLEQMVDFWSNHLNVPLMDDTAWFYRPSYDAVIRRFALTRFDTLLMHTTVHPAMGLYLDNAVSVKTKPNENLGRELLELHTVGRGQYTEADVKSSAKLLTGYRVDVWWPSFRAYYDPDSHYTGPLRVMGFSHPNSSPNGQAAVMAYLRYLAHHPATARRIATKLCVRFVSDTPSASIVNTVTRAYLANQTAIGPTLLAMVDHPDFGRSAGRKVRTPMEDYVATVRSLGIRPQRPTGDDSYLNAAYWQYRELGQAPYEWTTPDGYPQPDSAWLSTGRMMNSLNLHVSHSAGWFWGGKQVVRRNEASWMPKLPARFGDVVDHVSRQMFGTPATAPVRQGVARAANRSVTSSVTADDLRDYWFVKSILTSLLDSPLHLHR